MSFTQQCKQRYTKWFSKQAFNTMLNMQKKYRQAWIRITPGTQQYFKKFCQKNNVTAQETFLPFCYYIKESPFSLASSLEYLQGNLYLQDIASQLPAHALNLAQYKGQKIRILDMAASPGSKTTQLAQLCTYYGVEYEIVALELKKDRIRRLLNNIQRMNIQNVTVYNIDALEFEDQQQFDIILLDAPCSGNMIADKKWLQKRDLKGIKDQAQLQKKLLKKATTLLKPQGVLLYSTCSQEIEENEQQVDWTLKELPLLPLTPYTQLPFTTSLQQYKHTNTIRLIPYMSHTQGFFLALFVKKP